VVIPSERSVDGSEGGFINDVPTDEVTKVEESTEGAQHLGWNMALDGREIHL
jgi:hypothetical protein